MRYNRRVFSKSVLFSVCSVGAFVCIGWTISALLSFDIVKEIGISCVMVLPALFTVAFADYSANPENNI